MQRSLPRHAFTLIEMITVMAVIAILAGLVLSVAGLVQKKGARSKADAEVRAMAGALESFKTDNGGYPQAAPSDTLDPRTDLTPTTTTYYTAGLVLYRALSGDYNADGRINATDGTFDTAGNSLSPPPNPALGAPKSYFEFKQSMLGGPKINGALSAGVQYLQDPFGYSYGYSTAGLAVDLNYRQLLATDPNASRPTVKGYNTSFDLWSTAGSTGPKASSDAAKEAERNKWIKNW